MTKAALPAYCPIHGADHAPLPWHIGPHYRFEIEGSDGRVASGLPSFSPRGEANARFIVTACNAHNALIAAITYALDEDFEWRDAREVLQQALANATGHEG